MGDRTVLGQFRSEKTGRIYTVVRLVRPGQNFTPVDTGIQGRLKGTVTEYVTDCGLGLNLMAAADESRFKTLDGEILIHVVE